MSEPATPAAAPANRAAAGASVIRIVRGNEESDHDRLVKKIVPSWVISGAVNAVILTICILVGRMSNADAKSSTDVVKIVMDEKPAEEPPKDLTNTSEGIDSQFQAKVENAKVAEVTVDKKDPVPDAPPGTNDTENPTPIDVQAQAGAGPGADPGLTAADGAFKAGSGGSNGISVAPGFRGRNSATRLENAKAGGGNEASELAVARGLAWLARQQRANGSWVYEDGTAKEDTCSATAIALLPFLAAGQTHKPGKGNTYQEVVLKGVNYLISLQNPATGAFKNASPQYMYAHAIAAVALCELYGMTGDKAKILYPAKAAIDYIIKAQGANGSWGYVSGSEGDTSIVGWQIQALRSAEMCRDIPFPKAAYEKSRKFLDSVSGGGSSKSTYGYQSGPGRPGTALTAVGLLCRYYIDGWGPIHPGLVEGVEGLIKTNPPAGGNRFNMYYYYYATQVVHFHEGDAWVKDWNPKMRDLLIKLQVGQDKPPALAGSWDKDGQMMGSSTGRLGTTCLALLTLEVYYRHLPLYKRGTDGKAEVERVK